MMTREGGPLLIRQDGRDFYLINGKLMPAIVGGKDDDDDEDVGKDFKELGFNEAQQKIINRIMANNKRQMRGVLDSLAPRLTKVEELVGGFGTTVKEYNSKFDKILGSIDKILADVDEDDEDEEVADAGETDEEEDEEEDSEEQPKGDEVTRRVAFAERRLNRQLKSLQAELATEKKLRLDGAAKLKEKDRDTQLMNALQSVGVVEGSLSDALMVLRPKTKFLEEEGKWVFVTKEGAELEDFLTGVETDLPAYYRKPAMQSGGSGSAGGGAAKLTQIAEKKKEVERLESQARRTGRDEDIVTYKGAQRELKVLEGAAKK